MKRRIIITGGHFTPAYAVIDELKKKDWDIYWIGISKAIADKKVESLEKKVLPSLGIPFYSIDSPKYHRNSFIKSLISIGKIFSALNNSFKILQEVKPKVILSFGSFVSFPVSFAAWVLGIPIVIHEQTTSAGLANKIVSTFSDKVAISFDETLKDFPKEKVVFTGNPVRKSIFDISKLRDKKKDNKRPLLYVTGGSRGSVSINTAVVEALPNLVKNYEIIHQSGELDFSRISKELKRLKIDTKNYHLVSTLTPQEVENIYSKCDLAIARSGANTVSEFAILGLPAIFIPLPNSASNEQFKNAQILESFNGAKILLQQDLSGESLFEEIEEIRKNLKDYKQNAKKARTLIQENAASLLVELTESVV